MHEELPDYYATLGLHRKCTHDDIRAAYRILAKAHHPDVNGSSSDSMARTQAINEAHHVLGDAKRRAEYDASRRANEHARASRASTPPIKQEVRLRLVDFFHGTTLNIEVRDPGHPEGFESYPLIIPPHTAPGTRFRISRASPFVSGRIDVRVKLRPDRFFKARGSDLRCDLNITSRRAESGGVETVRGATGNQVVVNIPARTARGEILRIRGEGLPKTRGGRGDLLARVMYRPDVRIGKGDRSSAPLPKRRRMLS